MLIRTRLAFVLGSVFCTLPALAAHQIDTEIGADLTHTTQKETSNEVIKDSSSELGFQLSRARVNFRGDVTQNVSYRLRLNLEAVPEVTDNQPKDANGDGAIDASEIGNSSAGATSVLDYALISHRFNEMFALSFGKQWIPMHTHEMYTRDWDEPMHETAYTGNTAAGGYGVGVGATITPAEGQELVLLLSNSDYGLEFAQSSPSISVGYAGSFADGMVKPMASYNMFMHREYKTKTPETTVRKSFTNSVLGVGVGVYVANLGIEADYAMVTYGKQTDAATDKGANSITGTVVYEMNGIIPFARYSMANNNYKDAAGASKKDTDNGLSVGVRYKGADWGGLSYHAAFQTNTEKQDAPGAKETGTNKILVGVALRPSAVIKD